MYSIHKKRVAYMKKQWKICVKINHKWTACTCWLCNRIVHETFVIKFFRSHSFSKPGFFPVQAKIFPHAGLFVTLCKNFASSFFYRGMLGIKSIQKLFFRNVRNIANGEIFQCKIKWGICTRFLPFHNTDLIHVHMFTYSNMYCCFRSLLHY